jgi:Na+-driven multidrug efflux pump
MRWLNFACFWLWQFPLAYGLAIGLGWGPAGVYWAIAIAFSTLGVAGAVVFKQGRWKSKVV